MKTFLKNLTALILSASMAFAQPMIPPSNISPVTSGSVVGRSSAGTGRGELIRAGDGITIANGTINATGAGGAPSNATYITQTPNSSLTNEQALSTLATGILKSNTGTGIISIAVSGTDFGNVTAAGTLGSSNIVLGQGGKAVATSSTLSVSGSNVTVAGNLAVTGNQTVGNLTTTNLTITGSITGVMAAVNGGTGFSSTALGNIIVGNNTTTYGQLGVGANGRVLTANSSATLGVSWDVAGGGNITGPTMTANAVVVGAGGSGIAPLASLGTTGHPLVSAGAGAPPAFGVLGVAGGGTSLATLTAQSILIGNGTNTPIQLAPGTSGNVVTSNGTAWVSAAPTGGTGTLTLKQWTAMDNQPPATSYATWSVRGTPPVALLNFSGTASSSGVFVGRIPQGADFTTGITIIVNWTAETATSGAVVWNGAFEKCNTDIDSGSFATGVDSAASTTSGTSGIPNTTSWNFSGAQIDGLAAGDMFRVQILRDPATAGDDMTGNAQLLTLEIQQR